MIGVPQPSPSHTASENFARLLGFEGDRVDTASAGALIGLEHEYVVRHADHRVDFRTLLREIDVGGQRLDPGDVNAHRCPWGGVVTADGAEAEVATPPVDVRPGFVMRLEAEAGRAAANLAASLPAGHRLEGYSTHLSVSVPDAATTSVCERIASSFGPALMLLGNRVDSPGLLIRPRPGRIEAAFEFATGMPLRASMTYLTGAVLASASQGTFLRTRLPPALRVHAVATADRVGWGLRRTAFGSDLLQEARTAVLVTTQGTSITAQEHLELTWSAARDAIVDRVSDADLEAADRLVCGADPLPVERSAGGDLDPPLVMVPAELPRSAFGAVLERCERPEFTVRVCLATWDLTVFHVASLRRSAFAAVPRGALRCFLDQLALGDLDSVFTAYLATPLGDRNLDGWQHARRPGLYDSIAPPTSFLAPEAAYVANAAPRVSPPDLPTPPTERYGKFSTSGPGAAHGEEGPSRAEGPRLGFLLWAGAILLSLIVGLIVGNGGARRETTPAGSTATAVPSELPTGGLGLTPTTPAPLSTATTNGQPGPVTPRLVRLTGGWDHPPFEASYTNAMTGQPVSGRSIILACIRVGGGGPGAYVVVSWAGPLGTTQGAGRLDTSGAAIVAGGINTTGSYTVQSVQISPSDNPAALMPLPTPALSPTIVTLPNDQLCTP